MYSIILFRSENKLAFAILIMPVINPFSKYLLPLKADPKMPLKSSITFYDSPSLNFK